MKLCLTTKYLAAAALAVAAFGAASPAHARSDLYFSIGIQGAPAYVEPAPVYIQPRPVYVLPPVYDQPRPVYVQPPVYVAPAQGYVRRSPPAYDYAYEEERAWRRAEWRQRHWRQHHQDSEQYQSRDRDWEDR